MDAFDKSEDGKKLSFEWYFERIILYLCNIIDNIRTDNPWMTNPSDNKN